MAVERAAPRYRLTPAARRDLDDIFDFTAERFGLLQAERYIGELQNACEHMAVNPSLGRDRGAVRAGYRRWIVGGHALWFRVEKQGIIVIRILHQRMDSPRHLT